MQKVKKLLSSSVLSAILVVSGLFGGTLLVVQPVGAADEPVKCAILNCDSANDPDGVKTLLIWILRILTGLVGIAAVGGLIWAGIMYASAGDKADQVSKAKNIIVDVVIGIIAYGLMFVALNWLIPGGVLG